MRIYTRGGDKGKTGIHGGERVDKDDIRIEGMKVSFSLIFEKPTDPFMKSVVKAAETAILTHVGKEVEIVDNISVKTVQAARPEVGKLLPQVKNIIGISSISVSHLNDLHTEYPSALGKHISNNIKLGFISPAFITPSKLSEAINTSYPSFLKIKFKVNKIFFSSSIIRIFFDISLLSTVLICTF